MKNVTITSVKLNTPRGIIAITEFIPAGIQKAPAVIMSHGFNDNTGKVADIAEILAQNGVYAVCYDFNGGGNECKSTGKTTDMSILTEQDDLRDMIAYVKGKALTDKLYLYGESQGGFVSALTAPEYDDIEGLFLVYPAFVIPHDWLEKDEADIEGEFEFMGVKISRKYYNGVPRYDVFAKAAEFKKNVTIWHGAEDNIVPTEYSLKLVRQIEKCRLTVLSGLGHWFPPEIRAGIAEEIASSIK